MGRDRLVATGVGQHMLNEADSVGGAKALRSIIASPKRWSRNRSAKRSA